MVRYIIIVVLSLIGFFVSPTSVAAHGSGPPFVRINGEYMQSNPILGVAQPGLFVFGSDSATSSGYLVGQTLTFDIDEQFFPNPYAQAQSPFGLPVTNQTAPKPVFRWDFVDGTPKQEGKTVRHAYTKPGTYIAVLEAKFPGKAEEYSQVNTIQLDVFPDRSYKPPVAKIIVEGKMIEDPIRETFAIKPMKYVGFDATASTGKIVKYQWDFGDTKGSEEKITKHRYGRDEYFPVAVLRVTDENNIISDTYVLLDIPLGNSNPVSAAWYAIVDFFIRLFDRE